MTDPFDQIAEMMVEHPPAPMPGTDADFEARLAALPHNDLGNAERFEAREGRNFIWVAQLGWLAWDGGRWSSDNGETSAKLAAQAVSRAIEYEAPTGRLRDG